MAALKPFAMPKWGIEMTEGTVAGWQVEEGKPFAKGDVIVLIETDKITNEVEADADGCLVRLLVGAQETKPVGALLAVMGPPDASAAEIDAFVAAYRPAGSSAAANMEEAPASPPEPAPAPPPSAPPSKIADSIAISPAARRAAEAAGLSVADIAPSGRNGRITRQDVDKAMAGSRMPVLRGPIAVSGQEEAYASPLARRIAAQNGVDLAQLTGTGPRGRICKADVLAVANIPAPSAPLPVSSPPGDDVTVEPMSAMRKTIARRLTEAKQAIPHIYLRRRVRADALIALRARDGKIGTINDYLIRAAALALREVPSCNVQVHEGAIHRFAHADIAMAVATDRGLITPIITRADEHSIADIAKESARLAQRARAGKLRPEEFQGGSFSISNLGSFGVESFDAVINPPQGAILAVGAARQEPVDDNGAIRIVPVLHLSLSCDHRAIDGVDGARFLAAIAELIENPERL
ncbi:2-oxo acid dehydrogenase subunit E2 [Erythrobacter sp. EC-HK427]|uniref:2-oxo acid dehydrogenase subunit E2 n=1 Tax=Erythrobacter sp. EC-HK427 TaxID=2038396 RepID=UPI001251CDEF|nr:2-oxo acid dehydrogenase subunit E2 [Erythrobacter sp. EC-HK427]VVT00256.1 Dihydrolipoamide acetyltransferase component of pyruvate dehydrogenase complex [Erythrobacter sp. EC-HK427]